MARPALPAAGARMEPIATLPVFFKLGGKRVVLAGGSTPAVWKAELLSAAGATVDLYAAEPCAELLDLVAAPPGGPLRLVRRAWEPDDLRDAAMAVGAIEDPAEAASFQAAARAHGVPVNVIDNPPFCDFQFGTIVSRSPVVIGISTDGAAPVFGQALRARIEALLPQGLRAWAAAARDWRPAVQAMALDFRGRRRFWEAFTEAALAAADRQPGPDDFERCRTALAASAASDAGPTLLIVGAGPGDPDAVTLAAVRALQTADVVLHGADVPEVIVGFARREAMKIAMPTDEEAARAAVQAESRPGRRVAWLDRGDPSRCEVWRARMARLKADGRAVERVAGLGRCGACTPACAGWAGSEAV